MDFVIEKSVRAGLIPIRKTVTQNGRTFQRTYWCKQKDLQSFNATAPAVEFLAASIETQKEMMDIVSQLEDYNQGLAAEIYNEMQKSGETSIKIADKIAKVSDWVTARETNMTTFLAGMRQLLNEKGKIDMADLAKTYQDVSYQYHKMGLELSTVNAEGKEKPLKKMGVIQDLVPMNWTDTVKEVGAALRESIKNGLTTLRAVWGKLGRAKIPKQPEELDYRLKENKGKLEELYEEYQKQAPDLRPPKRKLTEEQKLALEGTPAPAPKGDNKKKFTINPEAPMKKKPAKKAPDNIDISKISYKRPEDITMKELKAIKKQAETQFKQVVAEYGSWENVPEHVKHLIISLTLKTGAK